MRPARPACAAAEMSALWGRTSAPSASGARRRHRGARDSSHSVQGRPQRSRRRGCGAPYRYRAAPAPVARLGRLFRRRLLLPPGTPTPVPPAPVPRLRLRSRPDGAGIARAPAAASDAAADATGRGDRAAQDRHGARAAPVPPRRPCRRRRPRRRCSCRRRWCSLRHRRRRRCRRDGALTARAAVAAGHRSRYCRRPVTLGPPAPPAPPPAAWAPQRRLPAVPPVATGATPATCSACAAVTAAPAVSPAAPRLLRLLPSVMLSFSVGARRLAAGPGRIKLRRGRPCRRRRRHPRSARGRSTAVDAAGAAVASTMVESGAGGHADGGAAECTLVTERRGRRDPR